MTRSQDTAYNIPGPIISMKPSTPFYNPLMHKVSGRKLKIE